MCKWTEPLVPAVPSVIITPSTREGAVVFQKIKTFVAVAYIVLVPWIVGTLEYSAM